MILFNRCSYRAFSCVLRTWGVATSWRTVGLPARKRHNCFNGSYRGHSAECPYCGMVVKH